MDNLNTQGQPGENTAAPTDFQSFIPQEYKDKPYLKTIKDTGDLFKQFDNLQSSLGKKTGIPAHDAADDEWDRFFDTSGFRPKDASAYEVNKPELPEGADLPEDYEARMRAIIHESGLSPVQAKRLMGKYNGWLSEQSKAIAEKALEKQKEIDQEFESLSDKYFGKADKTKAFETAKKLMATHLPEDLQGHLGELDNRSLVILASFANDIAKKYIAEDKIADTTNSVPSGKSVQELEAEAQKIMLTPEYADVMNRGHEDAKGKVNAIYQEIVKRESRK